MDLPGLEDLYDGTTPVEVKPTETVKYTREEINNKLRDFDMLKNKGRGKAKTALQAENTRDKEGVKGRLRRERKEEEEREAKFKETLREGGIDPERYFRLHTTQETEELIERRNKRKVSAANLDSLGEEAQYRSYKKRSKRVDFDRDEYDRQKEQLGADFYNTNALNYGNEDIKPSGEKLLEMSEELEEVQARRLQYSRRRKWNDTATVDFINERNRNFNAKAKRFYDKYTEEIRENLERGTAL